MSKPSAARPMGGGPQQYCDLCGAPFLDVHCKLTCTRCGYRRDCSDP